jgi:hypothetical protein
MRLDPACAAWASPDQAAAGGPSRLRVGLVIAGAGSLSVAVLGLGLGGALSGAGGGSPATVIGGSHSSPTRATPVRSTLTPAGIPARVRGWTPGTRDSGIAHTHPVDTRP